MRCKYIYKLADKDVVKGRFKAGHQCTSNGAPKDPDHPYKGNCTGHARLLEKLGKLNLPEKLKGKKYKGKDLKEAGSKIAKVNKKQNGNEYIKELASLTGKGFDAVEGYKFVQKINPYPTVDSGAEKYLFAMWLLSPQDTRTPKSQMEFSALTGVTMTRLELWRVGNELLDMFDDHRKAFMQQQGHMVDLCLLVAIKAGSIKAMETYYDMFPVTKREIGGRGQGVKKKNIHIDSAVILEVKKVEGERYKHACQQVGEKRLRNENVKKIEDKVMVQLMQDGKE